MGKLFESLRRREPATVPPAKLPSHAIAAGLKLATEMEGTSEEQTTPEIDLANDEFSTAPFIEVPEITAPGTAAAPHADSTPAVVPFPAAPADVIPKANPRLLPASTSQIPAGFLELAETVAAELQARSAPSLLLIPLSRIEPFAQFVTHLSASMAAQLRRRILLIDTVRPARLVADQLQVAPAPGWEELLAGLDATLAVQRSRVAGVDVISAGNRLAQITPRSWARTTGRQLRHLTRSYATVLLTSPAWPDSPLGLLLAAEAAATCVTVESEQAEDARHRELLQHLDQEGRSVLGSLVMN